MNASTIQALAVPWAESRRRLGKRRHPGPTIRQRHANVTFVDRCEGSRQGVGFADFARAPGAAATMARTASMSTGLIRWWSNPARERPLAVLVLAEPGDGDEHGAVEPRLGAEAGGELVAVDVGQADVEQDDVGAELAGGLDGRPAVAGGPGLVARGGEQAGHPPGGVGVVVHHEHPSRARPAGPAGGRGRRRAAAAVAAAGRRRPGAGR